MRADELVSVAVSCGYDGFYCATRKDLGAGGWNPEKSLLCKDFEIRPNYWTIPKLPSPFLLQSGCLAPFRGQKVTERHKAYNFA